MFQVASRWPGRFHGWFRSCLCPSRALCALDRTCRHLGGRKDATSPVPQGQGGMGGRGGLFTERKGIRLAHPPLLGALPPPPPRESITDSAGGKDPKPPSRRSVASPSDGVRFGRHSSHAFPLPAALCGDNGLAWPSPRVEQVLSSSRSTWLRHPRMPALGPSW